MISLLPQLIGTTFIDTFEQKGRNLWDSTRIAFCFEHIFQLD
jgi:hypothetical protein